MSRIGVHAVFSNIQAFHLFCFGNSQSNRVLDDRKNYKADAEGPDKRSTDADQLSNNLGCTLTE